MKYLLTLVFTFAFITNAQEDVEYKHELEVNKAEYYIGTFNKGKDVEDLADWYYEFADWAAEEFYFSFKVIKNI